MEIELEEKRLLQPYEAYFNALPPRRIPHLRRRFVHYTSRHALSTHKNPRRKPCSYALPIPILLIGAASGKR